MHVAGLYGCKRADFSLINFRPIDSGKAAFNLRQMRHFEYGTRLGHFVQWKGWLQGTQRADLASLRRPSRFSFQMRVIFPTKFLIMHYPIRSRKLTGKRKFSSNASHASLERERLGWHTHDDHYSEKSHFTWRQEDLIQWDDALFWKEHGLNVLTGLQGSKGHLWGISPDGDDKSLKLIRLISRLKAAHGKEPM